MLFSDEILDEMRELIELRQADIIKDQELIGRLEYLLESYRTKRGVPRSSIKKLPELAPEPPPGTPLIRVVLYHPDGGEERYSFEEREVSIGRSSDNKIVLKRTDVSRRHAKLLLFEGNLILLDLNSENGTFLNGEKISLPKLVQPGDLVEIGDYKLEILDYFGAQK